MAVKIHKRTVTARSDQDVWAEVQQGLALVLVAVLSLYGVVVWGFTHMPHSH